MIPAAAANIPLALCSVVLRRWIDSYTGQIPLAVAASSPIPAASSVVLCTSAMLCLYHQLKKGTLVNVGIGRSFSSIFRTSRHTIQRRLKNNSWFFRNIAACRRKCTEAMFRITRQSNDSLQNIQAETGTIVETNSLPVFSRRNVVENRRKVTHQEPPLEDLYSNQSFDSCDCSNHDLRPERPKRGRPVPNPKRRGHKITLNRPITRNFQKCIPENSCGDEQNRLLPKKRKKAEYLVNESQEPVPGPRSRSEVRYNPSKRQSRKCSSESSNLEMPSKLVSRRYSERVNKQPKIQKITRKTRSGRVYAYRL